ncbi:MAG: thiamine pyrophosphate-dependent dehydrogenase E1 component subunit alpha [Caldilineaceae bacterium]
MKTAEVTPVLASVKTNGASLNANITSTAAVTTFKSNVLSTEQLRQMYRTMFLIRRVEESLLALAESGKIGGAMHTAIGHEANAVGMATALRPDDLLTCTYRGHHHALARGMDPKRAIAEVLGRADGFAKGKGGSMHFVEPSLGLMGSNGIVGAQVPHAAGMALASKLRGEDKVAITFFGDGALYQGLMHETFNMAQKWLLPIIFYCENNRYSEMTPISRTSSAQEIYKFVHAYGMNSVQIDGNDVEETYQAIKAAAERARKGEGPTFIEALTYRLSGHMAGDLETYRTKEELEMQRKVEPLARLEDKLFKRKVKAAELEKIRDEVEKVVAEAVEFAQNSPWPDPAEAYTDVYAD